MMASTAAPVETLSYRTAIAIYELPETGNSQEEFTLIPVELRFSRAVSEGNSGNGRRQIEICLDEVVVGTAENPVWDLRNTLTELGVAVRSHASIIARLLEFMDARVFSRTTYSVMVEMDIEEVVGPGPVMPTENNDQLDDFAFVAQVQRLREIFRRVREIMGAPSRLMEVPEWLREIMGAASRPTEVVDVMTTRVPAASEASIAGLEKVHRHKHAGDQEITPGLGCVICVVDEEDEEFARMPCSHVFHSKCLGTWLRKSATCPLCRFQLTVA